MAAHCVSVILFIFCFSLVCHIHSVCAVRTKEKIYVDISAVNHCFRRLNATHQIGCTSSRSGNVGVVHYLQTSEDFDWVTEDGPHAPYMVLMSSLDFNSTNVRRLLASGRVNGILVMHVIENNTATPLLPQHFSPDKTCPNSGYGLYNNTEYKGCPTVKWNADGNSLMFQDFSIPVFVALNETEINFIIKECYEKYNKPINGSSRPYPLCSAQLKARMDAAVDSVTCIRRTNHYTKLNPDQYCEPLGDKNIFASLKAVPDSVKVKEKSVILAGTRMDSFSLFDNMSPSADNQVTGLVALLAAAEAIGKVKDDIANNTDAKDILFVLFQGEAFDYIGSSRMVYDMQQGVFPMSKSDKEDTILSNINLTSIASFIELNQVGYRDNGKLWLHTDPITMKNTSAETERILDLITGIASEVNLDVASVQKTQPLPPSSVQRFLRKRDIPAVVLTDHETEYTNKYFNSRFDFPTLIHASYPASLNDSDMYDYVTVQAQMLNKVSTMLARSLYFLSTNETTNITTDVNSVTHMLYCFLYKPNCTLFQTVVDPDDAAALSEQTYPYYVGVKRQINHLTLLSRRLMALYLGDEIAVEGKDDCKNTYEKNKVHTYLWMQGAIYNSSTTERKPLCIRSAVDFSEASSPAFDIEDYDLLSGEYSTWTESIWQTTAFKVRIFLVPSQRLQSIIFSTGAIILLVSMLLVYGLKTKADVIFSPANQLRSY